jgi:hypothetical protein
VLINFENKSHNFEAGANWLSKMAALIYIYINLRTKWTTELSYSREHQQTD